MSELRKIRVQHVERDLDGREVKTDVDVLTDADAVTMDGKGLKERIGELINARVGEIIDGAPAELDTLKELAEELQANQSGVSTILKKLGGKADKKDVGKKVDKVDGKGLSTNDYTDDDMRKVRAIPQNPKYTDTTYDLSEYAKTKDLNDYALKSEVSKQDLSNYATKKDLESIDLSGYAKTRDLVTEARIREIATEIAYADYLFTSRDLFEKLNNAFKTNFSSSIKTTRDLVNSETAMTELINNPYALQAAFRSFEFNGQMANSSTAMSAVLNSSTAMSAVANSSTAMTAVLNSSTAMSAVLNSSTAMSAVANSSTAMSAVANSSTAMSAVANSSTAMTAVLNSSTAMTAVANSSTAMTAVLNSSTAIRIMHNCKTVEVVESKNAGDLWRKPKIFTKGLPLLVYGKNPANDNQNITSYPTLCPTINNKQWQIANASPNIYHNVSSMGWLNNLEVKVFFPGSKVLVLKG